MRRFVIAVAWCLLGSVPVHAAFSASVLLDQIIEESIARDEIPGAVLVVGHRDEILHRKAYGSRSVVPAAERMTVDTIFDVASLTKVVATTTAIMKLFEQGKLRLNDPVEYYLPEFTGEGREKITVRDLLTHFSGLRPDLDLDPPWQGYETGIKLALQEVPVVEPGTQFIYSDINFLLLGEIVRRLSGKPLDVYVAEILFKPLGMRDTMFRPPKNLQPRIAPTELLPGQREPLRGVVHDPTARYMGGVAGHAGLFSTADDLSKFAEMLLNRGSWGGKRLFQPGTILKFTTPQSPPNQPILRGLGWDMDSPYSTNRGELFPIGSFGHTGFTGTSIWIDPISKTYVILLTNSVHPHVRPAIKSLRSRVATVVAACLGIDLPRVELTGYSETYFGAGLRRVITRNGRTLTGLDVLERNQFRQLQGKRVGLITNHTGLTRSGERNIDVMLRAGIKITAIFSPEHGLVGSLEAADIPHTKDPQTGIPVWSLYRPGHRRPTREMLRDVDVLVFDIQDVGVRFYTYITTMGYALEEAAKNRIPFYVLDRPNPLTGVYVEPPVLDEDLLSFVGYYPLPLRHGMTVGELAQLFNGEKKLGAELHVIPMEDWQRGDWFDSTGLTWVNPSPNLRSLNAALLYPALAMLEAMPGYSVGRGTDAPFEQIGADWIDGQQLAEFLNSRFIPGVRVYPTKFKPESNRFAGQWIQGVRFVITDREAFSASRLGLELAYALKTLYPEHVKLENSLQLIGSREVAAQLEKGVEPRRILASQEEKLRKFLQIRQKYLIYPQ